MSPQRPPTPRRPAASRPATPRRAPGRPDRPAAPPATDESPDTTPTRVGAPAARSPRATPAGRGDAPAADGARPVRDRARPDVPPRPVRPRADRLAPDAEEPGGARTRGSEPPTGPTRTVTTYTTGGFTGPVRPAVVSTTSRERFAERARARRNLARRQVLLTAGGVLGVGGLAWLLLVSPVLALDPTKVEVTGAGTVVAVDQVLAVVAERAGTPLPRLDTVGLRDAVLDVPGVREARVVREWPDGLAVQLVSREPVAA
ncbi:cell division protein FtsQ/DivIB, partial [Cellulomonas sp. B6]|uniref:cell division protein FtsQ/DivIB n=1 Tax=Cellulomonas sp. B6 TaxID=1295626 RepID=UPI001CC102D4